MHYGVAEPMNGPVGKVDQRGGDVALVALVRAAREETLPALVHSKTGFGARPA